MTDEMNITTDPVEASDIPAPIVDDTPQRRVASEIMEIAGDDDEVEEAPAQVQEGSEAEESEPEGEAPEATPPEPPKVLVAKAGEKDVQISDDTVFTVKVNRKEEAVPLKDLIRNYQGKVPWEKHYQETLEHEKKVKAKESEVLAREMRNQKEEESYKTFLERTVEKAQKNPSEALIEACIKIGKSPTEILKAVLQQAKATSDSLENMSEEQIGLLLSKKSLDYERKLLEEQKAQGTRTKQEQDELASLETHIMTRLQRDQVPVEDYKKSEDELRNAVVAGAVKLDGMSAQQVADLIVENVLQFDRPRGRIARVMAQIAPGKENDTKLISDLHQHLGGGYLTNFTDGDLNNILKGVFGDNGVPETPKKDPVQAKVETDSSRGKENKPTPQKIPQEEAKPRMEVGDDDDPLTLDDLLAPYRRGR